jgi:hypothetical protein
LGDFLLNFYLNFATQTWVLFAQDQTGVSLSKFRAVYRFSEWTFCRD